MDKDRELAFSVTLADCEVQTFRAGGKGGQNQNKRDSAVRIIHHPSGARGESREERSQLQNKKTAFRRMAESAQFTFWVKERLRDEERGRTIEQEVEAWMSEENLRIEYKNNGKWTDGSREDEGL